MTLSKFIHLIFILSIFLLVQGCQQKQEYHGYIEGDLTYISSSISGQLTVMNVERGTPVRQGKLLFKLEQQPELARMQQALARVNQLQATLTDLTKGQRPSEIASLQAQIAQTQAQLDYANIEFNRRQALVKQAGLQQEQLDQAVENLQVMQATLKQLQANLTTAGLGSRIDQIMATGHQLAANVAALKAAEWRLAQKTVTAPVNASVFDRYFYVGEQVPANQPVLSLLDPNNIKAIFFIPETALATIKLGQRVIIKCDSCQSLPATIRFISPQAEYTPPVIYSRDTRTKLRYRIEAYFAKQDQAKMHPGQPIDIELNESHE